MQRKNDVDELNHMKAEISREMETKFPFQVSEIEVN